MRRVCSGPLAGASPSARRSSMAAMAQRPPLKVIPLLPALLALLARSAPLKGVATRRNTSYKEGDPSE